MKSSCFAAILGASALMMASSADATLILVDSNPLGTNPGPAGSTSLFTAIGTFNNGNQKARLEGNGVTTVQGGNPGNGWWGDGTPTVPGTTPVRSWEVIWNNALGNVAFNVYGSSDWTGSAAMSMNLNPVLAIGKTFLGLDIGGRLTSTAQSVQIGDVQFNDGSGFVAVPSANAVYTGSAFFNNYFAFNGTLGNFTLRGTTLFPLGTTTGDSMRFFVDARQGVGSIPPIPSVPDGGTTVALLGLALAGVAGLRRKLSL